MQTLFPRSGDVIHRSRGNQGLGTRLVLDFSSAMFAWVLFANLQANLTQFRCIPHYVTRRDVNAIIAHMYRHLADPMWIRKGVV